MDCLPGPESASLLFLLILPLGPSLIFRFNAIIGLKLALDEDSLAVYPELYPLT